MSAVLMLMALAADACAQPTYPSKAIGLIAAGANRDLSARLLGQKFAEAWGQNVIVVNRPGGNTLVSSDDPARPQRKIASLGVESFATTPAQFTELMKTDQVATPRFSPTLHSIDSALRQ